MSLLFNAITQQIDFSNLNLSQNQFTVLTWVNPSNVDATYKQLCGEVRAVGKLRMMTSNNTAAGQMLFQVPQDVTGTINCTAATNTMTANAWQYIAFRFDNADVTQKCRIYRGTLTSVAAEVSYASFSNTGTPAASNSGSFLFGKDDTTSFPYTGRGANIVVYNNKALTLKEIIAHQFDITPKTTGSVLYSELGWSDTATQVDWSGNKNNGTITGATVDDHVPLVYEDEAPVSPYIVASTSLAVQSISQPQVLDNINLTQANNLTANNITQSQLLDAVVLGVGGTLSVADVAQSQSLDQVALIQQNILSLTNISQAQPLDGISLTQASNLTVNDIFQSQTLDAVTLELGLTLSVAAISQIQSLEQVNLTQQSIITILNLAQTQNLESLDLTQSNILIIDDLGQGHILDSCNVFTSVVGYVTGIISIKPAVTASINIIAAVTGTLTIDRNE